MPYVQSLQGLLPRPKAFRSRILVPLLAVPLRLLGQLPLQMEPLAPAGNGSGQFWRLLLQEPVASKDGMGDAGQPGLILAQGLLGPRLVEGKHRVLSITQCSGIA